MNGSQQKGKICTGVVFTNFPKDPKNEKHATEHILNKALFIILPNLTSPFIPVHLVYQISFTINSLYSVQLDNNNNIKHSTMMS